ncbi:MAG: D-alanyl-D-alanine carboxypeptidase, partial [Alphaproteobacteria bacterium]|nr:D-alanyl-D-alanine carboxypeptidase [Alphaproteobacteria bacterium]
DLAKLAQVLIQKFPEYYSIFSEKEFTYNGIKQDNRNPLLYRVGGADGLKTGHTIESGYGLTGALKTTDGRRLVVIVNGLKTIRERDSESAKLATYGMAGFKVTTLISADKIVEKIPVWLGAEDSVEVITEKEVKVTLPLSKKEPKVTIVYDTPVKAPIKKGDVLAHLIIKDENINEKVNLLAVKDIEKAGYFKRVKQIISSWF